MLTHLLLSCEDQYDKRPLSLLTHLSIFTQLRNVAEQQIRCRFSERLQIESHDHSGQITFQNPMLMLYIHLIYVYIQLI